MIEVGDFVRWTSQSGGFWKEKKGRVLAIVPAGQRVDEVWSMPDNLPRSRMKWSLAHTADGRWVPATSEYDRAIVEVLRPKGRVSDYYAPRLSALEKCEEAGEER